MRPIMFIPLVVFLAFAAIAFKGLFLNPSEIPSARIGKPVPSFDLARLYLEDQRFSEASLMGDKPVLVNIFASWCEPCRLEHPILMALKQRGIKIYGLNNRDAPDDAKRFLEELGNPFSAIGIDRDGRVAIDWGVTGYPETFVVSADGTILFQHIGPLTRESVMNEILPLVDVEDAS